MEDNVLATCSNVFGGRLGLSTCFHLLSSDTNRLANHSDSAASESDVCERAVLGLPSVRMLPALFQAEVMTDGRPGSIRHPIVRYQLVERGL
jgi:hypothetical protein